MATQPPDASLAAPGAQAPAQTPDLSGLAQQLAAKHAATTTPALPKPGGQIKPPLLKPGGPGRKTAQEEAAEYLRRNNLVAVPAPGGAGAAVNPADASALPPYVVSSEFVATCAETFLKGVEAFRQRQVFLTAREISGGDAKLAGEFAKDAGAPPGCIDVMGKCAAEIAQKYQLLNEWSPEVFFLVCGTTWFASQAQLNKRLHELERVRAEAVKQQPKIP